MPFPYVVLGPVYSFLKDLTTMLKPQFDFVKKLDRNFEKLETDYDDLLSLKEDTVKKIVMNEANRTAQCSNWFDKARLLEGKFLELKERYEDRNRYLSGVSYLYKRRKLGSKIVRTTKDIVAHKEKMKELDKTEDVMREREQEEARQEVVELKSLNQNLQELLMYLGDETVKRIGVWGMAGIGKTTLLLKVKETLLLKEIEACERDKFDGVIWISIRGVREEEVVKYIQKNILRQLNLNPTANGNHNDEENADKISEALKKMKYLVFLDHVYSVVNLDAVGIPLSHNRGKVVHASIERHVCLGMRPNVTITVRSLPPEDAQTLFRSIVGDVINWNPRINDMVDCMVEELGGHPRLIRGMATTLKNQSSVTVWETILRECKEPFGRVQHPQEDLHKTLKIVIDQLLVDWRRCFLYVSLFPRGYEIYEDYLVECWIIQRFTLNQPVWRSRNDQTFKEARQEGCKILQYLIERSLLERSSVNGQIIEVPEQVRKLALIIANEGNDQLLVEAGQGRVESPPLESWSNASRISLMCNKLRSLPEKPNCPKNSTLFLQNNEELQIIPTSFFAYMSNLQLLDLCRTGIESLPKSLSKLVKLRGLYLNECACLSEIPTKIAKLKNLEVLDMRDTRVHCLPIQIGELGNLKCFRVSFVCNCADCNCADERQIPRTRIPPNLVKNLHQLEELTIILVGKERCWKQIVDAIVEEVAGLKKLTSLYFHFLDIGSQITFGRSAYWDSNQGLRSFKILVGDDEQNFRFAANDGICPDIRNLQTSVNSDEWLLRFASANREPQEITYLLKQASAFELIGHHSVKSLSDFGMENMVSLEFCLIAICNEMTNIVDGARGNKVFPTLKKLEIVQLRQLTCIWQGPAVAGSLGNLTTLILNGCQNLTKILSYEIIQQLGQLQRLRVQDCSSIEEIIEAENPPQVTEIDPAEKSLPKLEILELVNLPSLVSICRSDTLSWPKLRKIEIDGCPELRNLPLSTTNEESLHRISCNKEWWKALQLQHDLKQRLERCCHYNDCINGPPPYLTPQSLLGRDKSVPDSDARASRGASAIRPALASSSKSAAVEPPNDPSSSSWAD